MGGSPTPAAATSTTTVQDPQRQQLYDLAMPFLKQFAAAPPQLPTGGTVAPFDPSQVAGQEMALGAAAGPQQQLAGAGAQTAKFLSGDVLRPGTNPALAETISAATLPIEQQLTEGTLPAIRGAARTAGQFGSSRQGIAEGLAARGASQAEGATAAGIANQGYQAGLDALVKNLGLLPGTAGLQLQPSLTTSGVGDVRQQMAQALLGQANLYQTYPQLLPLLMGQSLAGIGSGFQPAGTTTSGTTTPPQANPVMQGLGLGMAGLGALGGGQGIAALLPFLPSDRRLKRDIHRLRIVNGVPWYRFRYLRDDRYYVGVMADEAPARAVCEVLGFKVVDYSQLGV